MAKFSNLAPSQSDPSLSLHVTSTVNESTTGRVGLAFALGAGFDGFKDGLSAGLVFGAGDGGFVAGSKDGGLEGPSTLVDVEQQSKKTLLTVGQQSPSRC